MLHGYELKKAVFNTICDRFEDWAEPVSFACKRGCAFCCTQNVTVTAVEARILLDHIVSERMQQRLTGALESGLPDHRAGLTTNQFARLCLGGEDPPHLEGPNADAVCPFLEHDCCTVYPVRPFSCRCFASTAVCRRGGSAVMPPVYLSAATAVSQIIEHLGQFDLWGNMLHVLYVIGSENGIVASGRTPDALPASRKCCTTAQPLPGFLIDQSEQQQIAPLIESIFSSTIDGKPIGNILNNR